MRKIKYELCMKLKTSNGVTNDIEKDVVKFDEKVLNYYRALYPKKNVDDEISKLFVLLYNSNDYRPKTKEDLHKMVCRWIENNNLTMDQVLDLCADYETGCRVVDLEEYIKIMEVLENV